MEIEFGMVKISITNEGTHLAFEATDAMINAAIEEAKRLGLQAIEPAAMQNLLQAALNAA